MLGNTAVWFISASESGNPNGSRSEITLHGNEIAEYWHDKGELEINAYTLARWPTNTTLSRVRALCSEFGGPDIRVKKGVLYVNDQPLCQR